MKTSDVQFSVDEWLTDGPHSNVEERATLCVPRIVLENRNLLSFVDTESREFFDGPVIPAVHLAEGIASCWWPIFGGRDREHAVLPWRNGYALPDLRFECRGSTFSIECQPLEWNNPKLIFMNHGLKWLPRVEAEKLLGGFVQSVVDRLTGEGLAGAEVQLSWERVKKSMSNKDERSFCEAAGALGVDPYAVSNADNAFIESAGGLFEGEALIEFLAAARGMSDMTSDLYQDTRHVLIDWISGLRASSGSRLPELQAVAKQVNVDTPASTSQLPWQRGYFAASQFRDVIGLKEDDVVSFSAIAKKLGGKRFGRQRGPRGIHAVVDCRNDSTYIHLCGRGGKKWERASETFSFARALGHATCFPDESFSTINNLHRAGRQAVGRAFAAEFVAPENVVLNMHHDGYDVDEIAGLLGVSSMVVNHQIENSRQRASLAA